MKDVLKSVMKSKNIKMTQCQDTCNKAESSKMTLKSNDREKCFRMTYCEKGQQT